MAIANNTSLGLDINKTSTLQHYQEPYALNVLYLLVFTAVIVASIFGNLVVVKAVLIMVRKPFTYSLVTNMAVAELISTLCVPFTITYIELNAWVFGGFLCKLVFPLQVLSMVVVTGSIAVISVRRYQVVTGQSLRSPNILGRRLVIVALWVVGLAISFPLFIVNKVFKLHTDDYCIPLFPNIDSGRHYDIARIFLSFVIPMVVMVTFYGAVAFNINKEISRQRSRSRMRIDSLVPSMQARLSTTTVECIGLNGQRISTTVIPNAFDHQAPTEVEVEENRNLIEQEKDIIRMFYIIILVFIVFYLPYQTFYVLETFWFSYKWKYALLARKYLLLLTYFPSALHPVCYGTNNKFYARAFKKLFLCKC